MSIGHPRTLFSRASHLLLLTGRDGVARWTRVPGKLARVEMHQGCFAFPFLRFKCRRFVLPKSKYYHRFVSTVAGMCSSLPHLASSNRLSVQELKSRSPYSKNISKMHLQSEHRRLHSSIILTTTRLANI